MAFAAGQAQDSTYTMDTLWGYSKSGPSKDKYGSLVKVATATFVMEEKSETYTNLLVEPVE